MSTSYSNIIRGVVAIAIGCAAGTAPAQSSGSSAPVNIGVLTPLSPPGDPAAGQLIVRGAELGAKYANARMGALWNRSCNAPGPITIVRADDSGLPEKGMAGFRSLVLNNKVASVLGAYDSTVALAVQPLSEEFKVPMMTTQAPADKISGNHATYTFQTHTLATDRSDIVARFVKEHKFKRVAILGENTDYGTISGPDMVKRFTADGIESQLWIYERGNPDLLSTLLQVKKFQPDVIYNMGVGASAYLLIKQSADVGLLPSTPMVVSYDLPIRPEFWKNVGALGNKIIFLSYYQPRQPVTAAGKWLQEEYQKMYGEPALYSSLASFGNVILFAQAMNAACSTEGEKVAAALEKGGFTSWNQANVSFPKADGINWHRTIQPIMVLQYTAVGQGLNEATILFPTAIKTGNLVK